MRRHAKAIVGSVVVVLGFGWLMHVGALPVVPGQGAFDLTRWWAVAAYVLLFCGVLVVRSIRWYWLLAALEHVPMRRVLTVSLIGLGAVVLLPFRLGEFVRPALIRNRGKISLLAATGTVGAERIIDGLMLSSILLLTMPLSGMPSPLPDRIGDLPVPASLIPKAAYSALAVFVAAFVAMGLFYWRRDFARRLTDKVVGLVSPRLAQRLADAVERVASGLGFLPRWRFSGPFLVLTALYWALNIAGVGLLMWAVGLEGTTYVRACVVTGVLALGVLAPNAPGFFGAFQLSLYAGLALFFAPAAVTAQGSAFVFLLYVIQVALVLLTALGAAAIEHVSPSEVAQLE